MKWIAVEDGLPLDGQAVLVRRADDNWRCDHVLSEGESAKIWRWQACKFIRGRTAEEARRAGIQRAQDQCGNNAAAVIAYVLWAFAG